MHGQPGQGEGGDLTRREPAGGIGGGTMKRIYTQGSRSKRWAALPPAECILKARDAGRSCSSCEYMRELESKGGRRGWLCQFTGERLHKVDVCS